MFGDLFSFVTTPTTDIQSLIVGRSLVDGKKLIKALHERGCRPYLGYSYIKQYLDTLPPVEQPAPVERRTPFGTFLDRPHVGPSISDYEEVLDFDQELVLIKEKKTGAVVHQLSWDDVAIVSQLAHSYVSGYFQTHALRDLQLAQTHKVVREIIGPRVCDENSPT